jgi:hypothetical protein
MVAERSIYSKRFMVTCTEKIRIENVGMSSDKQRVKRCRLIVLGFRNKANPFW